MFGAIWVEPVSVSGSVTLRVEPVSVPVFARGETYLRPRFRHAAVGTRLRPRFRQGWNLSPSPVPWKEEGEDGGDEEEGRVRQGLVQQSFVSAGDQEDDRGMRVVCKTGDFPAGRSGFSQMR